MNVKRIARLLKLLQTLQAGRGDNADGLAKACGISRRTAFRDLETLRAAGVPLQFDKASSRYSIADDYFLRPANFTSDEALAIVALTNQFGNNSELPFFGAARSAALKIQGALPASMRREIQSLARCINIRLNPLDRLEGAELTYQQLVESLAERRVARIRYRSLTEWDEIETKLRPYQLLFNRHTWYVIGRSSLHGGTRTFNLGRITGIELLQQKYARPRAFSIERYLGNAWNIMPGSGPDESVVLRFASMVANNVAEVTWHKTQRLERLDDGSLNFHVRVSGLNEIVWWILGYGDQVEVIRPAKLRKLVAQRAKNLSQLYEVADAPSPSGTVRGTSPRVKLR
jgi:predicted DNA-binding transcriptional regulator YafY